jgi:alkaline phosphatase
VKKKNSSAKKAIVVVITDGTPDSQTAVEKVICDASNALTKDEDEDLSFQFIQIGNDNGAENSWSTWTTN